MPASRAIRAGHSLFTCEYYRGSVRYNRSVVVIALWLLLLTTPWVARAQDEASAEPVHRFGYRVVSIDDVGSFPGEIERTAEAIVTVWQRWIGAARLRPVRIELVLLGDAEAFDAMKQSLAPELPPVSGFYATASHQAVVRYDPTMPDLNRYTAIHEVAHLVTASQVGPVDRWLSEGLSEYFETLNEHDQGITVTPNLRYEAELQPQSLREFLALSDASWRSQTSAEHYATAWSLVYFLMDSLRGRVALREVLVRLSSPLHNQLSASELLDLSYPGGLDALEPVWHEWLVAGEFRDQVLP